MSFRTLVFWVVTPHTPVDVSEQPAASKWSSGGRKRKEEDAIDSDVEASRNLALTAPSDYDGILWDVTSCKGTHCLSLKR